VGTTFGLISALVFVIRVPALNSGWSVSVVCGLEFCDIALVCRCTWVPDDFTRCAYVELCLERVSGVASGC